MLQKTIKMEVTRKHSLKTMLRWKLSEVMAQYEVKGVDLARQMGVTPARISKLRNTNTLPFGSSKAREYLSALRAVASAEIKMSDLVEVDDGV